MKTKKSITTAIIAVSLTTLSFIFFGLKATPNHIKKSYTGQELFSGIYFREGKAAAFIADLDHKVPGKSILGEVQVNSILNEINTKSPGFFQAFRERVYSGNPVLVKAALIDGEQIIINNAKSDRKRSASNFSQTGVAKAPIAFAQVGEPVQDVATNVIDFGVITFNQGTSYGVTANSLRADVLAFNLANKFKD